MWDGKSTVGYAGGFRRDFQLKDAGDPILQCDTGAAGEGNLRIIAVRGLFPSVFARIIIGAQFLVNRRTQFEDQFTRFEDRDEDVFHTNHPGKASNDRYIDQSISW